MRFTAAAVLCLFVMQGTWLSLSNGQEESIDCTTLQGESECCSSNSSCVYVECNIDGEAVTGCYNSTEAAVASCDDPAEAVDTCQNTTSTSTPAESGENANTTTPSGQEGGSTESPTEEAIVNCTSYASQADCCAAGNATACVFYNCTDQNGTLSGTFCVAANSTPQCENQDDTPSGNICAESGQDTTTPSGSENPTQSPSSGGQAGGQQFDAASFIGGIVLCAGILAIGYFGIKFYKSRQERNYQSM